MVNTVREISRVEIPKKNAESAKKQNSVYSRVDILLMVAQNSTMHSIF